MLTNIVFDMGGVMIRWDPPFFIHRLGITDPADQALLLQEVYHCPQWKLTDLGEMSEKELEPIVLARLPERLHEAAHQLIFHWDLLTEPIAGMAQLARDCKAAGLHVYLLSNASCRQPEYWSQVPGSEVFDGTVVSGFIRKLKPSPDIYNYLLETFRLKADECLFIDDMDINVRGARAVGMDGFVFTGDANALRQYIADRVPNFIR